ncbi:unnamed protein product [Owenia fusiformis]|uniref:Uncharacterized protein n=1 Tax=Owenia fusiformis TaxID=6347 RepID=A0A8J1U566_OWEFU|nr:unnamed protein product [Owenia fusiformis]
MTLQAMKAELGFLSRPDGSSVLTQGDTSVIAAIYGPGDIKLSREKIEKATIDVVYKPKSGLPGCDEKVDERMIRNICETSIVGSLHPRTAINIITQEVQDSGSLLSCCINASSIALLDAAIPQKFTVAAVTCVFDKDDELILNPNLRQEKECKAAFTFVFESTSYETVATTSFGSYGKEQLKTALAACKEASKTLFTFYKDLLTKKLSKD